jgi:hypothetical protein
MNDSESYRCMGQTLGVRAFHIQESTRCRISTASGSFYAGTGLRIGARMSCVLHVRSPVEL